MLTHFSTRRITTKSEFIYYIKERYTQTHALRIITELSRITESNHIQVGNEVIRQLSSTDQFNEINIVVGTKVSAIQVNMLGRGMEIWGHLTPKTITHIEHDDTGIIQLIFNNDPTDIWPKQECVQYDGSFAMHCALYKDYSSADEALVTIMMAAAGDFQINNKITESKDYMKKQTNETTVAGCVASLPNGKNSGGIFKGVSTRAKTPNSDVIKEEDTQMWEVQIRHARGTAKVKVSASSESEAKEKAVAQIKAKTGSAHAESAQLCESTGAKVEAWGYVYNKRDQRVMWRKEFSSEAEANKWADSKNATVQGCKELNTKMNEAGYGRNRGYEYGFASPTAPKLGNTARQDDEKNSEFDDKMRKITGMIFYNNVNDPELATALGLKQTRAGKWHLKTGNRNAQKAADAAFGPGKVWYPSQNVTESEGSDLRKLQQQWWVALPAIMKKAGIDYHPEKELDRGQYYPRLGQIAVPGEQFKTFNVSVNPKGDTAKINISIDVDTRNSLYNHEQPEVAAKLNAYGEKIAQALGGTATEHKTGDRKNYPGVSHITAIMTLPKEPEGWQNPSRGYDPKTRFLNQPGELARQGRVASSAHSDSLGGDASNYQFEGLSEGYADDGFGYKSLTTDQIMKLIRSGNWESMADIVPGKHLQLRNTRNGKTTTIHVKQGVSESTMHPSAMRNIGLPFQLHTPEIWARMVTESTNSELMNEFDNWVETNRQSNGAMKTGSPCVLAMIAHAGSSIMIVHGAGTYMGETDNAYIIESRSAGKQSYVKRNGGTAMLTFEDIDQFDQFLTTTSLKYDDGKIKITSKEDTLRESNLEDNTESENMNQVDKITVDVPLVIRLMEYAREDAQSDMDLHNVAEQLAALSQSGQTLTMQDYESIIGSSEVTEDSLIPTQKSKKDNFTADDINQLVKIKDLDMMKQKAKQLISTKSMKKMKPEKVAYFADRIDGFTKPMDIVKAMYDMLLAGEGHKVVGSRNSMKSNSYASRFDESEGDEEGLPHLTPKLADHISKQIDSEGDECDIKKNEMFESWTKMLKAAK